MILITPAVELALVEYVQDLQMWHDRADFHSCIIRLLHDAHYAHYAR